MKTWIKLLIIGWSIVSVAIIIVSYQVMKYNYVTEDYSVELPLRTPVKGDTFTILSSIIYHDDNMKFLSKQEFIEHIKDAKSINLHSSHTVKNRGIYLYLPLYSFVIWAFPILIFALLGILFERSKTTTPPND